MGFHYVENHLYCDQIKIAEIAKEVETPFYLYSYTTLIEDYTAYIEGFKELNPLICYSYKANSNLAICKVFALRGSGADVVSGGELFKALRVGVPSEKIVFNGNGKSRDEIEYALREDILMFNVDSIEELIFLNKIAGEICKTARIALRINPNIRLRSHPYISTALRKSKFGIDISKAEEAYRIAREMKNIEIMGVHTHIGSQIIEKEPFLESFEKLTDLVIRLNETGIEIKYINMGGGLGITYKDEKPPTPKELASGISPLLRKTNCRLIIEPGRSLVGKAGALITKVLYIKEAEEGKFVVVDAGMNDLLRPTLYGSYHRILPVTLHNSKEEVFDVVGPICESGDFLAKTRKLPRPKISDYFAILDVGAYGFEMASNYNSRTLPPEIMVIEHKFYVTRRRETYQDLIKHQEIPKALLNG